MSYDDTDGTLTDWVKTEDYFLSCINCVIVFLALRYVALAFGVVVLALALALEDVALLIAMFSTSYLLDLLT